MNLLSRALPLLVMSWTKIAYDVKFVYAMQSQYRYASCEDTFLHKIRGLLRVYDHEVQKKGEVEGGLQECQKLCKEENRCRSIGYAQHLSELDPATGLYLKKERQ
ncbi:uncharacterized protein TNCV_200991 [Trichonephila clavipes]|nr:uncharacterized protein TNCV_200991 [Trichonephila clavipes]